MPSVQAAIRLGGADLALLNDTFVLKPIALGGSGLVGDHARQAGQIGAIHEVTSPDDNLQAVFQYLVKA